MTIIELILILILWSAAIYCIFFILHILRFCMLDYLHSRNNNIQNENENIQDITSSNNDHTVIINPNNSIYIATTI